MIKNTRDNSRKDIEEHNKSVSEKFQGNIDNCAICIQDFKATEVVVRLKCAHTFHRQEGMLWDGADVCPWKAVSLKGVLGMFGYL